MKKLFYILLFLPFLASAQQYANGIKVGAPIIPNNPLDAYPTGYSVAINGGYHSYPTLAGRDSLNTYYPGKLRDGMQVYVRATSTLYQWNAGSTTWGVVTSGKTQAQIDSAIVSRIAAKADTVINPRPKNISVVENKAAFGDLTKAYVNFVTGTYIGIGDYGDSTSPHVWSPYIRYMSQFYPYGVSLYPSPGNNLAGINTGVTTSGTISYTGNETVQSGNNDGTGGFANFTYLPGANHITLENGAILTIPAGQQTGFIQARVYLAKGPGLGTATVDLINANTSTVEQTATLNCSNTTITADATSTAKFAIRQDIKYTLRITASGRIVHLISGFFKRGGLLPLNLGRGSSSFSQNNYSNRSINQYLSSEFNVKGVFVEAKEENPATDIPLTLTTELPLRYPNSTKIIVGSPTDSSSTSLTANNNLFRQYALQNNYVYFGADKLMTYQEAQRLGFMTDVTHWNDIGNQYLMGYLVGEMPQEQFALSSTYRSGIDQTGSANANAVLNNISVPKSNSSLNVNTFLTPATSTVDSNYVYLQNVRRMQFGPDGVSSPRLQWNSASQLSIVDAVSNATTGTRLNVGIIALQSITQAGALLVNATGNVSRGTIDLSSSTYVTNILGANNGGTGQNNYTVGDLLYAPTTTTLGKLTSIAAGNVLLTGGVSTAPLWGKVGLTSHVSGTLPIANGGTGMTSFTANGLLYATGVNSIGQVPAGINGQFLSLVGGVPTWSNTPGSTPDTTLYRTVANSYSLASMQTKLNGYVPTTRTITINGTALDLSSNRSYSVGTVTAITPGYGHTSTTPITTSGTISVDSAVVRSVANSYSLAGLQTKLNNYVTTNTGQIISAAKQWNGTQNYTNTINAKNSLFVSGAFVFKYDSTATGTVGIRPPSTFTTGSRSYIMPVNGNTNDTLALTSYYYDKLNKVNPQTIVGNLNVGGNINGINLIASGGSLSAYTQVRNGTTGLGGTQIRTTSENSNVIYQQILPQRTDTIASFKQVNQLRVNQTPKTGSYSATLWDRIVQFDCTAGNVPFSLPSLTNGFDAVFSRGSYFTVTKTDATANTIQVSISSGGNIWDPATQTNTTLYNVTNSAMFYCDGNRYVLVKGNDLSMSGETSQISATSFSFPASRNQFRDFTSATLCTATLPSSNQFGDIIELTASGTGGVRLGQNSGDVVFIGAVSTTGGAIGYTTINTGGAIRLRCTQSNTGSGAVWRTISSTGTITPL